VDERLLARMFSSGCTTIYFGVESGSQETIDKIGKRIDLRQAEKVFEAIRKVGGSAVATFILGFPWETVDDMKKTIKFALKLDPDYAQFTYATPYPGTPLYEMAKEHDLIVDHDWSHYTTVRPVMRGFHFGIEEVEALFKEAYTKFYVRLKFLARQIRLGLFKDFLKTIFNNIVLPRLRSWL